MRPHAAVAAFLALLISELALGDLPLLGAMAGALLGGVLAAMLSQGAREAAAHALGASAAALVALALLNVLGPVLPGAVAPSPAVTLAQASLLAGLCPLVAWLLARFAPVTWAPPPP
ncbi:MAG: hypothetical protein LC624_04925 [Halobacteriales archaeon]|nr:hypothetical protein [Halobacteriales archaeon]